MPYGRCRSPTHRRPRADTPPSPQRANRRPMAPPALIPSRDAPTPAMALTTGAPQATNVHMSMRELSAMFQASPIPGTGLPSAVPGVNAGTGRPTSWPPDYRLRRQTPVRFRPLRPGAVRRRDRGPDLGFTPQQRADALDRWSEVFPGRPAARAQCGPGGCRRGGHSGALVHPIEHFRRSGPSMRMDLTVSGTGPTTICTNTSYGSAAVIGLQMVSIPAAEVRTCLRTRP